MFSFAFLFLICTVGASRFVPSKLGLDITQIGKITIGVEGENLRHSVEGCTKPYHIWYPTTKAETGTKFPGHCPISVDTSIVGHTSLCPLKLDSNGHMEIVVDELPAGCTVSLTNAYVPSDDDETSGGVPIAAIVVACVIVAVLFGLALLGYFVFRSCYNRRRSVARAAQVAGTLPTPSDSLPTALPPSIAPSSSAILSSTTLEKKPSTTDQTSNNPMPSSSNAPTKESLVLGSSRGR